jgi:hypothetical protein
MVVPVLAAMAVFGIVRAKAEVPPMPLDAASEDERYVIQPGAEPLFADMLGRGQTLPGGCTFANGQIQRTTVLATYTCGGGQVVLQLSHPELAPPGGVRTQRFAVTVRSGAPPAGLIDAVAERIRAREATFQWKTLVGAQTRRWPVLVAAGALVAAVVVLVALRRFAARRRRPA